MKRAEIELIKKSFWDYDFKDSEIEKRISFLRKGIISDERFFLRILENFSWHFLIELIPEDILLSLLTDKLINKIRRGGRFCLPLKLRYKSKLKRIAQTEKILTLKSTC